MFTNPRKRWVEFNVSRGSLGDLGLCGGHEGRMDATHRDLRGLESSKWCLINYLGGLCLDIPMLEHLKHLPIPVDRVIDLG